MIRIGLVGSASNRADIFARLLNVERVAGDRARCTAIWSSAEPARTAEVARANAIPEVAGSLHNLVDRVDAAIVVDRHGDLHAEHALPFLLDGKPVHVIPPLAIDLVDCRRMITAARRSGAALSSFSAMSVAPGTEALGAEMRGAIRLAQLAGPCDIGSPHGGPYFMATHLIDQALTLLGDRVVALRAARTGDTIVADAIWEGNVIGSLGFHNAAIPTFRASVFGRERSASREMGFDDAAFTAALLAIVAVFEGSREPHDVRRLLQPIVLARAMVRSLDRSGEWIDVADMLDAEMRHLR